MAFQTHVSAQTIVSGPETVIESLDLSRPELAAVKAAADRKDIPAARKAFADYLRGRNNVVWHFDPAHPPAVVLPFELQIADNAVKHLVNGGEHPWQFNGPVDWKFNPTTQPDSKWPVTHEWPWGLNRHAWWPILARAYLSTGDEKYSHELCAEISDWCEKNPEPVEIPRFPNPTWRTIEAGIRMSTSWPDTFFSMVRSSKGFPDDVMLAMVDTMRQHAEYLVKYPSPDGNWKTMESNGLAHVGILFPEFKAAPEWRRLGLQRQRDELDIQVYPDGTQTELTPSYQGVALLNFLGTYKLAVANKASVPEGYKEALERMFDADMWGMLPDRSLPNFNDSGRGNSVAMLANGVNLFPQHEDWNWFATAGKSGHEPKETSHFFPYAGWSLMRSSWSWSARCLAMDGGPYGTGHQHEDKLSFIMDAYDSHLIAEAGVYQYEESPMRRYCLSPAGHNELSVDGFEQHRRGRDDLSYVTKSPLNQAWTTTPAFDYVQASYGDAPEETWGDTVRRGFLHTRRILFAKPDYWVLIDTMTPADNKPHTCESWFHLDGTSADIDPVSKSVITKNDDRANVAMIPLATDDLSVRIIQGETKPTMRGWVFDTSSSMRAVPTPYFTRKGTGPIQMLYVIAPIPAGKKSPVTKVEPANVPGAQVSANITFRDGAAYGSGMDKVWLDAAGAVHIQRTGTAPFSAGPPRK